MTPATSTTEAARWISDSHISVPRSPGCRCHPGPGWRAKLSPAPGCQPAQIRSTWVTAQPPGRYDMLDVLGLQ